MRWWREVGGAEVSDVAVDLIGRDEPRPVLSGQDALDDVQASSGLVSQDRVFGSVSRSPSLYLGYPPS